MRFGLNCALCQHVSVRDSSSSRSWFLFFCPDDIDVFRSPIRLEAWSLAAGVEFWPIIPLPCTVWEAAQDPNPRDERMSGAMRTVLAPGFLYLFKPVTLRG